MTFSLVSALRVGGALSCYPTGPRISTLPHSHRLVAVGSLRFCAVSHIATHAPIFLFRYLKGILCSTWGAFIIQKLPIMAANQFTALVMDLGGVFFDFDSHADSSIGPLQLKAVLGSPTWHTYECGQLPQQECYDIISKQFGFAAGELERAINLAATTLRFNRDLVEFVKQMKKDANGKLRVFAMSNVSQPDFEILRDEMEK